MADDTYNFDAENYRLVGVRSRRVIMLGDAVKIRVLRADLKRKQLDYELVAHKDYHTGRKRYASLQAASSSRARNEALAKTGRRRKREAKDEEREKKIVPSGNIRDGGL